MTTLGEAFIEVKADTRPFARDLERKLKAVTASVETALKQSMSRVVKDAGAQGRTAGQEFSDKTKKTIKKKFDEKKVFVNIGSALASALDDGISALPTNVKAAIVAGIILSAPAVSAALGSVITAGVAVGVAGLGSILAFQYEEVKAAGTETFQAIRTALVEAAEPFGPAIIGALAAVEERVTDSFAPKLGRIFEDSAKFVEPLTTAILDGFDRFFNSLEISMSRSGGFVRAFADGFGEIIAAVGESFEILSSTGADGERALSDLLNGLAGFIVTTSEIIAGLTELYGVFRDLFDFFPQFAFAMSVVDDVMNINREDVRMSVKANEKYAQSFEGTIAQTQEQEAKARELEKAYKDTRDATYGVIEGEIAWKRSLVKIKEQLDSNKNGLDLNTEAGRRNTEVFIDGLRRAEARMVQRVAAGEISAEQAAKQYDKEIKKLKDLAGEAGISRKQFDKLFGSTVKAAQVNFKKQANSLQTTASRAAALANALQSAAGKAHVLQQNLLSLSFKTGKNLPMADGGIVYQPTNILAGEAGAEVIVPLTKPARARELAEKSGLLEMLRGTSSFTVPRQAATGSAIAQTTVEQPVIYAYIGADQIDARIDYRIERRMQQEARTMLAGARRI